MIQWLKDVLGNLLGRSLGRQRFMLCEAGHIVLTRLPDNSQCGFQAASERPCDAIIKPLTEPLWGIFPLSQRVIMLQARVFKIQTAGIQYQQSYQAFLKQNEERNDLVLFFRAYFPEDLENIGSRSITELAVSRLKRMAHDAAGVKVS